MSHWKKQRLKEVNKILKVLGHRQHKNCVVFYENTSKMQLYKNKYSHRALIKNTNIKIALLRQNNYLSAKYNRQTNKQASK